MVISPSSSTSSATPVAAAASSVNTDGSQDRFLKLLVAQLSNQDPMNPMDNAQMTSQMAQISTVSSIEKVNQSLAGLAGQLASLQTLQAGSLVGRNVMVQGNRLALDNGKAVAAVDLDLPADRVTIDILSAGGQVLDSIELGASNAGRRAFEWDGSRFAHTDGLNFRVTATKGSTAVTNRTLVQDKVVSVGADAGVVNVQLQGLGSVAYDAVKAIF